MEKKSIPKPKVYCPCCLEERPDEGHQCPHCDCNTPPLDYNPAPHLDNPENKNEKA